MAFSLIAHDTGASSNASTALTGGVNTTGAKLIVVNAATSSASSVSDNMGNTYTPGTVQGGGSGREERLWYCINPNVGANHIITVTAAFPSVQMVAFSNPGTVSFDQESGSFFPSSPGSIFPG